MNWTRIPRIRLIFALVALGALSIAALALAATTKYEGKVKHAGPVSFRVGHGSVKRFQASMNVSCVSAAPPRSDVEVYVVAPGKSAKLGKGGRFAMNVKLPKQQFRDKTGHIIQTLYSVKTSVKGNVRAHSADGTVKVSYNKYWTAYNPGTGYYVLTIASCFSGKAPVRWTAKRG